jgi:hypothetical protein
MSHTSQFAVQESPSDRRSYGRERVLFSCAQLGDGNGGIILNISEGGVALRVVAELAEEYLPKMRFQFSHPSPWVEASGRVAWLSESRKTVGVEFTQLTDEARQQIRKWLASVSGAEIFKGDDGRRTTGFFEDHALRSVFAASRSAAAPRSWTSTVLSSKHQRLAAAVLASTLLIALFLFLGHRVRQMTYRGQGSAMPVQAAVPGVPVRETDTPIANSTATTSAGLPAYALQMGAMAHKDNAEALANSLRQRNFPAFVRSAGGSRLYLVLVGPYDSAARAAAAKRELKSQGFEAISIKLNGSSQR